MENTNQELIEEVKNFIQQKELSANSIQSEIDTQNGIIEKLSSKGEHNSPEMIQATKEASALSERKNVFNQILKVIDEYTQSEELLGDEELGEMAQSEMQENINKLATLYSKLQALTQVPLLYDSEKAILEFRPGVGGAEASLFAEELLRAYTRYANQENLKAETLSIDYDSEGGIKEASVILNEPGAFGKIRFESGVHRVQRVPTTESGGRIHTSSASIAILPKLDIKNVEVDMSEIRVDVYRSSGPGGQSVNTTDSAVRLTHEPTGLVVTCQSGKSQHQNKEMALEILQSKLLEIEEEKKLSEANKLRTGAISSGDRSAKIRTYNFPQGRITDHRINKSWHNIEGFMNGEIGDIVEEVNVEMRKKLEE